MQPYQNLTVIGPDTDPALLRAMIEVNTIGVVKNNEGNVARERGNPKTAEELHLEVLQLKLRGFGEGDASEKQEEGRDVLRSHKGTY